MADGLADCSDWDWESGLNVNSALCQTHYIQVPVFSRLSHTQHNFYLIMYHDPPVPAYGSIWVVLWSFCIRFSPSMFPQKTGHLLHIVRSVLTPSWYFGYRSPRELNFAHRALAWISSSNNSKFFIFVIFISSFYFFKHACKSYFINHFHRNIFVVSMNVSSNIIVFLP